MLLVTVKELEVHALLDTGATTSIISKELLNQLSLKASNEASVNMYSCDGSKVQCEGVVQLV